MEAYKIIQTDATALAGLKQQYLQSLPMPLDGMWQVFVAGADHFALHTEAGLIGYAAINAEHKVLQFYLEQSRLAPGHDARTVFAQLVAERDVVGAVVATCEPHFLALCSDLQTHISVNSLMYQYPEGDRVEPVDFAASADFQLVDTGELATLVAFAAETLGAEEGWLKGYYADLIARGQLFGLWQDGQVIATGELRASALQKPYADVGMVVSKAQRGCGLATKILRRLIHICQTEGLRPICSTEQGNLAAQTAIARAGFRCDHRILDVAF